MGAQGFTSQRGCIMPYQLWHRGQSTDWVATNTVHPSKSYAIAVAQAFRDMGHRGLYVALPAKQKPISTTLASVNCGCNDNSHDPMITSPTLLLEIARRAASTDDWLYIYVLHHIFLSLQGTSPN